MNSVTCEQLNLQLHVLTSLLLENPLFHVLQRTQKDARVGSVFNGDTRRKWKGTENAQKTHINILIFA